MHHQLAQHPQASLEEANVGPCQIRIFNSAIDSLKSVNLGLENLP